MYNRPVNFCGAYVSKKYCSDDSTPYSFLRNSKMTNLQFQKMSVDIVYVLGLECYGFCKGSFVCVNEK